MAKYTITIKSLMDNNFDFKMTDYPIFDENYREILNNKILYHYYENEIGFETAPLFRLFLNQKLNEIMPYYNELYRAQKILLNDELYFKNVNLTENYERKSDTLTNSNSNSNSINNGISNNKELFQDTPQGEISKTDIDNQKWATNVTFNKNETNNSISDNTTLNGSSNNTENYIKTILGNNGNKYSIELLKEIKNNIMNIDIMIINDLNDLFMQIF